MNYQKAYVIFISVIIVVILAGLVAYLVLINKSSSIVQKINTRSVSQTQNNKLSTSSPADEIISSYNKLPAMETATKNEIENWKNYRNTNYHFEFKYPLNYLLTTDRFYGNGFLSGEKEKQFAIYSQADLDRFNSDPEVINSPADVPFTPPFLFSVAPSNFKSDDELYTSVKDNSSVTKENLSNLGEVIVFHDGLTLITKIWKGNSYNFLSPSGAVAEKILSTFKFTN